MSHKSAQFLLQEERLAVASGTLVPLETAIKETIEYTRNRNAFGQPILNNQYVHFKLAELQTELELYRALTYQAADAMERGENITLIASMLKLKSGRLSRSIPDQCLQFWGGMGYSDEMYISRLYRDLRLGSIFVRTENVVLGIICKEMGILPSFKKNKKV